MENKNRKFNPGDIVWCGSREERLLVIGYSRNGFVVLETLCKMFHVVTFPEDELSLVPRAFKKFAVVRKDTGAVHSVRDSQESAVKQRRWMPYPNDWAIIEIEYEVPQD